MDGPLSEQWGTFCREVCWYGEVELAKVMERIGELATPHDQLVLMPDPVRTPNKTRAAAAEADQAPAVAAIPPPWELPAT